jgi:hypothetical protein
MEQDFGTEAYKLARSDGSDTSHDAADSVDTTHLEQLVYGFICSAGPDGCISDEVRANFPGLAYSSVTARYRALLDKDYIADTGKRRPGKSGRNQRVMVASKFL